MVAALLGDFQRLNRTTGVLVKDIANDTKRKVFGSISQSVKPDAILPTARQPLRCFFGVYCPGGKPWR